MKMLLVGVGIALLFVVVAFLFVGLFGLPLIGDWLTQSKVAGQNAGAPVAGGSTEPVVLFSNAVFSPSFVTVAVSFVGALILACGVFAMFRCEPVKEEAPSVVAGVQKE